MDLVAAGGRVHASEIDMEALARQSASFCTVNPDDSPDALARENEQLKLRLAAEQQCLLREQHITARMWIEKSQAKIWRGYQARVNREARRCEAR
mgnify:CR=1 FL=1|jgi:hypothetical protein